MSIFFSLFLDVGTEACSSFNIFFVWDISDVNHEMDVGLHGGVSTPGAASHCTKVHTVHERAFVFQVNFVQENALIGFTFDV